MKKSISAKLRRAAGSLVLSAGVLSIANIETIWQEIHHADSQESHELLHADHKPKKKANLALSDSNFKPLQSVLSRTLEEDELKDENPFAHLSNLEPLQQIMKKGVSKFHRETLRSPDYQGESGYDMVSYEIEHVDGSKSSILAFLDRADETTWHNVGAPDDRIPYVIFTVANGAHSDYTFYRAGALLEQGELTGEEAETLVTERINSSIPFLSVSR